VHPEGDVIVGSRVPAKYVQDLRDQVGEKIVPRYLEPLCRQRLEQILDVGSCQDVELVCKVKRRFCREQDFPKPTLLLCSNKNSSFVFTEMKNTWPGRIDRREQLMVYEPSASQLLGVSRVRNVIVKVGALQLKGRSFPS
jgi:hypothetical protein